VMLLGDLPESIALLNRVHGRGRGWLLHLELGSVDLGHAVGVAKGEDDLFGFLLVGGLARQFHLVALDLDPELGRIEAVTLNLLLQLLGRCGSGAPAEDLGASLFDELEQTHVVLLFSTWLTMAKLSGRRVV